MNNHSRTSNDSALRCLVREQAGRWTVISRTTQGQDYCWVTINHDQPRVGPPPIEPSLRTDKVFNCGVLCDNDWSINTDYWDSGRPYRSYIPTAPHSKRFPAGQWVAATWTPGKHWGDYREFRWYLSAEAHVSIIETWAVVRTLLQAVRTQYRSALPLPQSPSLTWLNDAFVLEEALASKVADTRRRILDAYGYIAYHLLRDSHWKTRPNLVSHVEKISDLGLPCCSFRGCIVRFDSISYDNLRNLLNNRVPIHYQWYTTDTGAFDLCGLRAYDYDDLQRMKHQPVRGDWDSTKKAIHPVTQPNAMSVAPSATPVAGSTKAKAKYYKMNGRKTEMISKKLYKDLAKVYFAEHLKRPMGDIFIIKEDVMKMPDDNSEMGEPVITKADMATHLAKMTSAAPDKEASQISELVDTAAPVKTFIFAAGRGHLHDSGVIAKSQCSSQPTEPIASEDFGDPTLQAVTLGVMTARAPSPRISGLGLDGGYTRLRCDRLPSPCISSPPIVRLPLSVPHCATSSHRGPRRDDKHGPVVHQQDHCHYKPVAGSSQSFAARIEADSGPSSSAPSLKRATSFLSSQHHVREHKWEGPLSPLCRRDTVADVRVQSPVVSVTRFSRSLLDISPAVRSATHAAVPNATSRVPKLPVLRVVPSDEGLQRINKAFGANVARFISPPHLAGITFPSGTPQILGRLITTFRTAIRVAYDLFCNPNASPADSVPTLLSLGASYRIMTPMPVRSLLAHPTRVHRHIAPPPYLDTHMQYSGMNLKATDFWNQYQWQVRELLGRPYARRFLTMGGIAWRLALQFGPPELARQALDGPSSDVTVFGRGDIAEGYWDDSVTPGDLGTLIGRSSTGVESCWPPQDVWESSSRWMGFWTYADEKWFQTHLQNLSSGNLAAPKTRKNWKRAFRPTAAVRLGDSGTEIFARNLLGDLGYCTDKEPCWNLSVQVKSTGQLLEHELEGSVVG